MKHKSIEQLKKTNDLIAIANIIGLIKKDEISKAIDICEQRKFTPKQFGKIANMVNLSAEEIYKNIMV